jgi:hypothetical protein
MFWTFFQTPIHVRTDEFAVLNADPDDCHLRAAVRVDRCQVGEQPARDLIAH